MVWPELGWPPPFCKRDQVLQTYLSVGTYLPIREHDITCGQVCHLSIMPCRGFLNYGVISEGVGGHGYEETHFKNKFGQTFLFCLRVPACLLLITSSIVSGMRRGPHHPQGHQPLHLHHHHYRPLGKNALTADSELLHDLQ